MGKRSDADIDQEILDISQRYWDTSSLILALEIKKFLQTICDADTRIPCSNSLLWPPGAPKAIDDQSSADMKVMIGGKEFDIKIRKSDATLLAEGFTYDQLGEETFPPSVS